MTTFEYSLADRYTSEEGRVFLTGVQALARVPIERLRIDRANGLETAAFLSGYQGSPLGGFDLEMARAARQVPDLPIELRPAVNEELGATAVMGSQLVATQPDQRYDGVVGFWYGKSPGLDRAADAMRHAVFAGTSRNSGAVALVGDDPACKSSTLPTSSDVVLVGLLMPVLYPGDVQEVLDLGRHAVEMSRLSGMWTSLKIVTPVADGSGTVDLAPDRVAIRATDTEIGGELFVPHPSGRLIAPYTLTMEQELRETRLELARRYGVVNDLNHCPVDPPGAWIGIAASGYTYSETLQALDRLGLDSPAAIAAAGIRLLQVRLPYPLDPGIIRRFAQGLDEIVVVEEKGPTLEGLMKDVLYNSAHAPRIVGKNDEHDNILMVSHGLLDADHIIEGLRRRLSHRLADRLAPPPQPERARVLIPLSAPRKPYFCSGCPHNWGTKVPDGALVGAGIGCHGMALLMNEDKVGNLAGVTAMGGEGAQWIGMAPFLDRDHFIQNLGDGTFFHSGQLAVQASVASGANITYKLLYNGTVAMTGAQDVVGGVGVPELVTILVNHGVNRVLVTTDDTSDYHGVDLPPSADGAKTEVWPRSRIIEAQEMLAKVPGVTVLVHDQDCAAQTRRLRKRGQVATPAHRVVINHRICEACGDCGEVSNCLSVQSIDTPLGPKTAIDQTSCNLDFSCLDGDCPSFMTVEVGDGYGDGAPGRPHELTTGELPKPRLIVDPDHLAVRLAGIGGTGVVTVAQVLGTAAMLDGFEVRGLDQTGLSQKAGPVVSDLRLSRGAPALSNLIGAGEADLIIAFDLLVGASEQSLSAASASRTVMIASSTETQTGEMIGHPELDYPSERALSERIGGATRRDYNRYADAGATTRRIHGDASTANVFMLGMAYQAGCIPVSAETIEQAIDLNGVAVSANLLSFRWGRRWANDPASALAAIESDANVSGARNGGAAVHVGPLPRKLAARIDELQLPQSLAEVLKLLAADLVGYQDKAYGAKFCDVVAEAVQAEQRVRPGSWELTEAVARGIHKIWAYKDEYEVARLLIGPEGAAAAAAVGGEGAKVRWRLHPPMLRTLGMSGKMALPAAATAPAMRVLAAGKRLRGTALDPFGRAEVRRIERALLAEYTAAVRKVIGTLSADTFTEALTVANLAQDVRGYEQLKLDRAAVVRARLAKV